MIGTELPPTRAGLLALNNKIRIAQNGHRLLKMKRDVLILELKRLSQEMRGISKELETKYRDAQKVMAVARMKEGTMKISFAALSVDKNPEISVTVRNVMGSRVPIFSVSGVEKDLTERGYGLIETSLVIDESADAYGDLVQILVRYAGIMAALLRLTEEISTLKRRVNALEQRVLPDLISAKDRILLIREELEREERVRLSWAKKRMGEHNDTTVISRIRNVD